MRAAIILAAGSSRRFGTQDKLAVRLWGRTLLDHVIANAWASGARRVILVSSRRTFRAGVTTVHARFARDGLSASLTVGLAALRPIEREALIFLADMPFAFAPRMMLTPGMDAARPHFGNVPGHPMLVRARVARKHVGEGDRGLVRALRTASVPGNAGHIADIDTRAAFRRARLHGSRAFRRR